MAKISRLGGMSDAVLGIYPVATTVRTSSVHDVHDAVSSQVADVGEEAWSVAGGDSTIPTSSVSNSNPSGEANPFLPAPTMGSLSSSDQTPFGSVGSMGSESLSDK